MTEATTTLTRAAAAHPHFRVRHRVWIASLNDSVRFDAPWVPRLTLEQRLETPTQSSNAASFTQRAPGSTVERAICTAAR